MSDLFTVFDELSVSFENPAGDAMGYDAVEGKLICEADAVVLQFKQKDRAFRKNPILTARFDYLEIESVEFLSKWFQAKRLIFRTSAAAKLDSFPGANVGKVDLFVCRESVAAAKKVAARIDFRQSEARLSASESRLKDRSNPS